MKTHYIAIVLFFISSFASAQVKISTNNSNPNSSAMLDIESTTKGLLLPRMTNTQMATISNPALGLLIFNITDSLFYMHLDSGWTKIATGKNNWLENGDKIYNSNYGNVGIATNNPTEKLHVNGNILADGNIYLPNSTSTTGVIYKDGIPFLHNAGLVAQQNVYLGTGAGSFNVLAKKNVAIGSYALANSDGADNIAIGFNAAANLSGGSTYVESLKNLFVGYLCGQQATGGIENVAIGNEAGFNLKAGSAGNVVIGSNAGRNMTTGVGNVLIGNSVLTENGVFNTGIGGNSGTQMKGGSYNTWLGADALASNKNGNYNVALGRAAGQEDTTGFQNVYIGAFSGVHTQGTRNIFIGSFAGEGDANLLSSKFIVNVTSSTTHLLNGDFASLRIGIRKTLADLLYTLDVGGEIRIGSLTSAPSINNGVMYYNSIDNKLKTAENGTWKNVVYDNTVKDKNTDPNTTDVPTNTFHIWRNTSNGNIYLWVNDNGTMRKVQVL
jgi:hypothetical protein